MADRDMACIVSKSLCLLGQASNMVEIRVDVAKEALYVMGILGFVQDLRKVLEDYADSIEAILPTNVSAGHGDLMTKNARVSKAYQQDPLETGGLQ